MKLSKYLVLGLAGLAFVACSKDDNVPEDGAEVNKTVINLSFGRAESRGMGESMVEKYNTINDLDINFYNAQGNFVAIPETYTDLNGDVHDNAKAVQDAVDALKGGASNTELTIYGVPNSATQVYIVANQPAKGLNDNGIDLSSINKAKASHIFLSSQKDCLNSTLTSMETGGITEGKVNATLTPISCRFELKDLMAKKKPADWTGAEIKSFVVKGIYVNRFYPWGVLSGADINHDQIANGSDPKNYEKASYAKTTYNYNGTGDKVYDFGFMCDGDDISGNFTYSDTDLDAQYVYSATTDKTAEEVSNWWGYQVLPGVAPHLVIKLSVVFDDGGDGTAQDKYLVVEKYKDGNGALGNIERGKVYQISNLEFDASHLVEVPYEGVKTVEANITVAKWVAVPITPDFSK